MLDNIELNKFTVFISDCNILVSKLLKDLTLMCEILPSSKVGDG